MEGWDPKNIIHNVAGREPTGETTRLRWSRTMSYKCEHYSKLPTAQCRHHSDPCLPMNWNHKPERSKYNLFQLLLTRLLLPVLPANYTRNYLRMHCWTETLARPYRAPKWHTICQIKPAYFSSVLTPLAIYPFTVLNGFTVLGLRRGECAVSVWGGRECEVAVCPSSIA